MLVANDLMNRDVIQLERGATIREASATLRRHNVGCLIVTAGGYPVGIVTETDIVGVLARGQDPNEAHIEDVMSSPLFSVSVDTDVLRIATTMATNRIKKMPVIERQRVVGIITQTDIVKVVLRTITDLHGEFSAGHIGAQEYANRSQELFTHVPHIPDAVKEWHMRCTACGYRFLADERKDGSLSITQCPQCKGTIDFDPTPPI